MKLFTVCCLASFALFAQNAEKSVIPRPPIPRPPIIIEPIIIKLPPEVQEEPTETPKAPEWGVGPGGVLGQKRMHAKCWGDGIKPGL